MHRVFLNYLKTIFILIIIICILFIPLLDSNSIAEINNQTYIDSDYNFVWPLNGYTKISSYFGRRTSPTLGSSTYHSGIDIPAPEGTLIYAIDDAKVIFASWGAGGGYTITLQLLNYPNIKVSYCHLSPIMYCIYGENVVKGQVIATVGPKNIYGIKNNPYHDENGNPTNGATTGCHLHFTIKIDNEPKDPLEFYIY